MAPGIGRTAARRLRSIGCVVGVLFVLFGLIALPTCGLLFVGSWCLIFMGGFLFLLSFLWDALANGESLQLSGDLSINEGVVEAGPDGTAPTEAPDLDGDGYPDEEPAPEEPEVEATVPPGTVVLPDTITGNKADQNTCSNGRG